MAGLLACSLATQVMSMQLCPAFVPASLHALRHGVKSLREEIKRHTHGQNAGIQLHVQQVRLGMGCLHAYQASHCQACDSWRLSTQSKLSFAWYTATDGTIGCRHHQVHTEMPEGHVQPLQHTLYTHAKLVSSIDISICLCKPLPC